MCVCGFVLLSGWIPKYNQEWHEREILDGKKLFLLDILVSFYASRDNT